MLRIFALAIVSLLVTASTVWATASRPGELSGEARLLNDVADGAIDEHELVAAMIAAGGTPAEQAEAALDAFRDWLETLPIAAHSGDRRARAALIFSQLHRELLRGQYQATCSDVAQALTTGNYNCLSATVLFIAAARHCGLEVAALATEGHVLCEFATDDGWLEVETTCPAWFRLNQADARAAKEMRLTPVTRGAQRDRLVRRLSDVELLAKVYYNRGVTELRSNHYEQGLALTQTSLRLDPSDTVARGNVLAGLNNWALALCREGDTDGAAQRLAELRTLEPGYPTLADNEAHIQQAKSKALAEVETASVE